MKKKKSSRYQEGSLVGDTAAEILEALVPLHSGGLRSANGTRLSHQDVVVPRMATVLVLEHHQPVLPRRPLLEPVEVIMERVEVIMERVPKEHQSHGQAGAPVSAE